MGLLRLYEQSEILRYAQNDKFVEWGPPLRLTQGQNDNIEH
jgi:hypothetical protein